MGVNPMIIGGGAERLPTVEDDIPALNVVNDASISIAESSFISLDWRTSPSFHPLQIGILVELLEAALGCFRLYVVLIDDLSLYQSHEIEV